MKSPPHGPGTLTGQTEEAGVRTQNVHCRALEARQRAKRSKGRVEAGILGPEEMRLSKPWVTRAAGGKSRGRRSQAGTWAVKVQGLALTGEQEGRSAEEQAQGPRAGARAGT